MPSRCTDNPKLGIIGCGATYTGNQQHSVVRVAWSCHEDSRAHLTFSTIANADRCWRGTDMLFPSLVGLVADNKGIWKMPPRGTPKEPLPPLQHRTLTDRNARNLFVGDLVRCQRPTGYPMGTWYQDRIGRVNEINTRDFEIGLVWDLTKVVGKQGSKTDTWFAPVEIVWVPVA